MGKSEAYNNKKEGNCWADVPLLWNLMLGLKWTFLKTLAATLILFLLRQRSEEGYTTPLAVSG